ncbi:MAG: molybdopterin-dependent oxidoreductase [Sumerlaeia bacterium]
MSETTHRPIEWSTLEEYEGTPDVLNRMGGSEWNTKPEGFADKLENLSIPEWKLRRRTFMKMSGFAAVLSMVAGCEKPLEHIIPYNKAPEEIIVGIPNYYASTCGGCSAGCGTLVKTREGRPLKLEGNPRHKLNQGKLCALGQASLVGLYDPDRLRKPVEVKNGSTNPLNWADADAMIAKAFKSGRGVLLTGTMNGVAKEQLLADFMADFPNTKHVMFDALTDENRSLSREASFGDSALPQYHFDQSELTVLLGSDPYVDGYSPLQDARNMAEQRRVKGYKAGEYTMGQLYAFEPMVTSIGMSADYRFGVKPTHLLLIAQALIGQLLADGHSKVSGLSNLNFVTAASAETQASLPAGTIKTLADRLWEKSGRSIIYTGGTQASTQDSLALHTAVNVLNAMLGNEGETITTIQASLQSRGSSAQMAELIEQMKAGQVDVILVHNTNPAYALPADSGFDSAFARVPLKVSASQFMDETAKLCDLVLPGLHFLENWGDHEPVEGYLSLQQPTIQPLWDNRAFEQTLIEIVRASNADKFLVVEGSEEEGRTYRSILWREYIQNVWQGIHTEGEFASDFQDFWFASLRSGVLELPSRIPSRQQNFNPSALAAAQSSGKAPAGLELALYATVNIGDGSFSNIPHLLELPDPVTKVCWDNYFTLAPATAKEQGIKDGDLLEVTANGTTVEGPARIQPGLNVGVVGAGLGWGRTGAGKVGDGEGFNAYLLASAANKAFSGASVTLKKLGKSIRLADVQGHNYMRKDPLNENEPIRQLIQATSLVLFNDNAKAPQPYYHIPYWDTTKREPDYWFTRRKHTINGEEAPEEIEGPNRVEWYAGEHPMVQHKWVMTIDLNTCTGCNACVTACQIENNVPVVGKREVLVGREMHWIRLDRYYKGDIDNPEFVKMPMLCQHCDNAPCETVCPVLATVHSDEGLNQQVYNRCVGTRYCANNCPYKVRRFSFYHYSKFRKGPHEDMMVPETPLALALNPEVTVRSKGIMEKCSFCTQRIRHAKYDAKKRGQDIPNGELQSACQQTCPTQAITFGDAMNPEHDVNKIRAENNNKRGFGVLEEFNVQPNIMYLAHIHNRETRDYDVAYHLQKKDKNKDDQSGESKKDSQDSGEYGSENHTNNNQSTDNSANESHSAVPAETLKSGVRS